MRGAESIVELQSWLGHAEVRTTMRYTHYCEQADAAARLARAFETEAAPAGDGAALPDASMPDPESIYLPDAGLAWIPEAKLHSYALNPDHPDGGHKARVFETDLGLRRRDWAHLRDAILRALPESPVHEIRERGDGAKSYTVVVEVAGLNRRTARVTTGWYVEPGKAPRLATLYIDKRHRR